MTNNTKLNKQLSGIAGEYYVAAELSRNGYLAAVTLRNSDSIDILASNVDGKNQIAIQVKTTQGKDKWILSKKVEDETNTPDNKYFVFVSLPDNKQLKPQFSIIKASELREFITKAHRDWLAVPGKNRTDHNARQYEEVWARDAGFQTFSCFDEFLSHVNASEKSLPEERVMFANVLSPTLSEPFFINVEIPKCKITFDLWQGTPIANTFGGKPLIDVGGKPMFAELAIMHMFLQDGWEARWLESYGRGQRNIVCLSEWADLPYSQQTECPIANENIMNMLLGIAELNGGNFNGCWDVLAWKGNRIIFAESKRSKRDKVRDTQTRWLDAALRYGLNPENFLVVEWEFGG